MDVIKSKDNSKIKYVRSLNNKKNRETDFVVEGYKLVEEAIYEMTEKSEIKFILISESEANKNEFYGFADILKSKEIDYYLCDNKVFNSVADTINSQGILAVAAKKVYNKEDILTDNKFIIMCDRIQDPGNLGTIIRTADAFGPAAVILNKGCADIYNPKVVRAAAGALFRVPFITGDAGNEIISYLKNTGYKIISAVVDSNYSFNDIEKSEKICVVIGNEGQGVSQEILDYSDLKITIKMTGRLESLNASIAAGISIYEIRKKLL
jgi:TrmH family RNA methyltransferase